MDSIFCDSNEEDNDTSSSTGKPLRKGRLILNSGFIEDIQDYYLNGDYLLRAHVQHSKEKTYPLEVCVVISGTSGSVKHGTCNCIASALGRCVHVTALLLHLRYCGRQWTSS